METWLALTVGGLYAAGIYMMMRRSLLKLIIGLSLLGHAANLLIFTAAGLRHSAIPIIPEMGSEAPHEFADPLPQALILTAIVISFGVQAFALALIRKVYQTTHTEDLDNLKSTDT